MRKIGKTNYRKTVFDGDVTDTGTGRVPGASITSWPGPPRVDLEAFFARSGTDASISGSAAQPPAKVSRRDSATIVLSDGTSLSFVTSDRFEDAE